MKANPGLGSGENVGAGRELSVPCFALVPKKVRPEEDVETLQRRNREVDHLNELIGERLYRSKQRKQDQLDLKHRKRLKPSCLQPTTPCHGLSR